VREDSAAAAGPRCGRYLQGGRMRRRRTERRRRVRGRAKARHTHQPQAVCQDSTRCVAGPPALRGGQTAPVAATKAGARAAAPGHRLRPLSREPGDIVALPRPGRASRLFAVTLHDEGGRFGNAHGGISLRGYQMGLTIIERARSSCSKDIERFMY
jgi:hypothetical protein